MKILNSLAQDPLASSQRPTIEVSIVMPCLNEAETIGTCVTKAWSFFDRAGVAGEVVVADNGSMDGSQNIARALGARVVDVSTRGYGAALLCGIDAARGQFVVMGDADDSYDFAESFRFIEKLRAGADLVVGNRFKGEIEIGAMPFMNKYLGNPVLSFIGRLFFQNRIGDFHCGLRAFSRQAILDLDLRTTGMEFASEMIVRAALGGLSIEEVPVTLHPDGRSRAPHLRPWRDGWRHLRFLLLFCPRWLFLYPGLALLIFGTTAIAALLPGQLSIGFGVSLDVHTMLVAGAALAVGVQSICFAFVARQYATAHKLMPPSRYQLIESKITLENFVVLGVVIFLGGLGGIVWAVFVWKGVAFGDLGYASVLRLVIVSTTALITGSQLILTGFLAGIVAIGQRD